MNEGKKLISVIIPVLNEGENVARCYETVKKELVALSSGYDHEILFTDNRSSDKTFSIIKRLAEKDACVRAVRFSKNFGYQRSIYTGYCLARGDVAIQIDCDLQDPPSLIPQFLDKWRQGYQVVYGVRHTRKENGLVAALRGFFYRLIDFLSEDALPHDAGDFRLVDRKVLGQLKRLYDADPYLRGTIATLGFEQAGIPYDRDPRAFGKSKFGLKNMMTLAVDGILNHSIVPLRLATLTGFIVSAGLVIYLGSLIFLMVFFHETWPRGFATTAVLILISISVNALFLGVIGEYLGRIYRQVKQRPITIIDETVNLS